MQARLRSQRFRARTSRYILTPKGGLPKARNTRSTRQGMATGSSRWVKTVANAQQVRDAKRRLRCWQVGQRFRLAKLTNLYHETCRDAIKSYSLTYQHKPVQLTKNRRGISLRPGEVMVRYRMRSHAFVWQSVCTIFACPAQSCVGARL